LSYGEIRKVIKSKVGYSPPRSVLRCWLRGLRTLLGRIAVFDVRQSEVGLIMGLVLSNGNEHQHHYNGRLRGAKLVFYNSDEGILEVFKGTCRKLGLAVCQRLDESESGQEKWRLEGYSTLLYLPLKRFDDLILRVPTNVQAAFLRGLMLGDKYMGSVPFYNTSPKLVRTTSILLKNAWGKA